MQYSNARISLKNFPQLRLPRQAWEFAVESGDDESESKLASRLTNTNDEERSVKRVKVTECKSN